MIWLITLFDRLLIDRYHKNALKFNFWGKTSISTMTLQINYVSYFYLHIWPIRSNDHFKKLPFIVHIFMYHHEPHSYIYNKLWFLNFNSWVITFIEKGHKSIIVCHIFLLWSRNVQNKRHIFVVKWFIWPNIIHVLLFTFLALVIYFSIAALYDLLLLYKNV